MTALYYNRLLQMPKYILSKAHDMLFPRSVVHKGEISTSFMSVKIVGQYEMLTFVHII
jgi:hypothetical protein